MMNYKEAPKAASPADQQRYAEGILQMASLAEKLHAQDKLPERFAPEPTILPSSLEGKVQIVQLIIGGKSGKDLLKGLVNKHVNIGSIARYMAESAEFTTLPKPEQKKLVIGHVGDLVPNPKGNFATTQEIWAARDQLRLEEVPAETALHYLLQKSDELQIGDPLWMSMKTIADRRGRPHLFGVARYGAGLWLYSGWARPSDEWGPEGRFAFCLPQVAKAA